MNRDDEQIFGDWFDSQTPLDEADSEAQIAGLLARLAGGSRVLDLGCGSGRVLVPLAQAGRHVVGIDRRKDLLDASRRRLEEAHESAAELIEGNFLHDDWPAGPFDAVLCLGQTLATIWRVDEAVALFERVGRTLGPGGVFLIDDFVADFWSDVAEGNWQAGISEDGQWQMVWAADEPVVAIRRGAAVEPDNWSIEPADRPIRLWTRAELELLGRLSGLTGPARETGSRLMHFTRPGMSGRSP